MNMNPDVVETTAGQQDAIVDINLVTVKMDMDLNTVIAVLNLIRLNYLSQLGI